MPAKANNKTKTLVSVNRLNREPLIVPLSSV